MRVFPLVHRATGAPVEFLPEVLQSLRERGAHVELRRVPYVFQRDADTMVVLRLSARNL